MGVGSASLLDFLISDRKTRHLVVHPRHAFARRSAPVNSLKSDLGGNRNDTFRRLNQLVDHTQERPWDREASASHSGRSGSSALPGFACVLSRDPGTARLPPRFWQPPSRACGPYGKSQARFQENPSKPARGQMASRSETRRIGNPKFADDAGLAGILVVPDGHPPSATIA